MHDKSTHLLPRVLVATSNPGKIRDFEGAARNLGVRIGPLPGFDRIPRAVEDGATFEENARIKAEHYSRAVPGELVLADDSGLAVDALNGAPGVHSARYAAVVTGALPASGNSADEANNRLLIDRLQGVGPDRRSGKFVCALAAARDGVTLAVFHGQVQGQLLTNPRGNQGFGYDPLFFFPQLGKTFAEISAGEKARYSHRGEAFRKFLDWYGAEGLEIGVVFDSKSK